MIIGGDGSYKGALDLCKRGIRCVGIPGTIDNDLPYTEMTLGYDTAVNVCMDAVRSIRATSRSHDRPHVVEVMGRHCGDIAMKTAMATGAEMVIVPEVKWDIRDVIKRLNEQIANGNPRATIVIGENAWDNMEAIIPGRSCCAKTASACTRIRPFPPRCWRWCCGLPAKAKRPLHGHRLHPARRHPHGVRFAPSPSKPATWPWTCCWTKPFADGDGFAIGVHDGRVFHTSLRRAALKEDVRALQPQDVRHHQQPALSAARGRPDSRARIPQQQHAK